MSSVAEDIEEQETAATPLQDLLIGISILVSSITFFKEPFEGYLHYVIFALYLPVFISRYGWESLPFKFIAIPALFTIVNVLIGDCTMFQFIKVFVGMLLSVTFYHYVLLHYNYDFKRLMNIYLKGIIFACYIGVFQLVSFALNFRPGFDFRWLLNKWGYVPGSFLGLRMNSIFSEPSQFALLLLPAVFIATYCLLLRNFKIIPLWKCLLIYFCLIMSTSSTGYVGILFSIIILSINFGRVADILVLAVVAVFGAYVLYLNVPDFKSRVDASVNLWTKDVYTLDDINTSSFVQFNNSQVAWNNLIDNPLFGTGLGSFPNAYEKYSLTKAEDFLIKKGFDFNSMDGNSLFFRSMAEMGLIGVIFWIVIVFKFFTKRDINNTRDDTWVYSGAMLVIILGYLLRQGNYFINGFPFFVLFYCFIRIKHTEGAFTLDIDKEDDDEEGLGTEPSEGARPSAYKSE